MTKEEIYNAYFGDLTDEAYKRSKELAICFHKKLIERQKNFDKSNSLEVSENDK